MERFKISLLSGKQNCTLNPLDFAQYELSTNHFLCFSLGPLVGKVKEYHIESIVDNLCTNMLSEKEQLRDISSIGKNNDLLYKVDLESKPN